MRFNFYNILFLLSFFLFFTCSHRSVKITDKAMDEGQECYCISTSSATFYYQKEAGGFSSILDTDGIDWINFHPDTAESYPVSAASSYRGLPNLVFRSSDGGAGHPGFNKCVSEIIGKNKIRTVSKSGKWAWIWTFEDDHALLEIIRTDPEHAYWLLYEGTINGRFQPHLQYWGNDRGGPNKDIPDYYFDNSEYGYWKWVYFGDESSPRIFFIAQLIEDDLKDMFGYLGNTPEGVISPDGMIVFGMGRDTGAIPLMTDPQKFVIGFIELQVNTAQDHQQVVKMIYSIINLYR